MKYKGLSSMNYKERGSHARDVYVIQDVLRVVIAKVKQE